MAAGEYESRFGRAELLLGPRNMARLRRARVAVFGLGAVGSYAVEALARAGVGFLRLVDCDVIRLSNFNRQLYALESALGRPKAEVARERVLAINPECEVDARPVFADAKNAAALLENPLDAAIDAIDALGPKIELISAAVAAGVPVVSCMGAATRTDPAAVRVADIAETVACPLARFTRKKLRKRGITSGVRCVFSTEPSRLKPVPAGGVDAEEFLRGRRRGVLGSLSYMTGIFGLTAAAEALRIILGAQPRRGPDS